MLYNSIYYIQIKNVYSRKVIRKISAYAMQAKAEIKHPSKEAL